MAATVFSLSCSNFTRKASIKSLTKLYVAWNYLKSLALVSVTWQTGRTLVQRPVVRFLAGYGGGGRTCGSLIVYSAPDEDPPSETAAVPFDD